MKVLIRADASKEIGIGHIMRTFAMAQFFVDMGTEVTYLCFEIPEQLEMLLERENIELIRFYKGVIGSTQDAELTADAAHVLKVDWVIADSYRFNHIYQKTLKAQGLKLMIIDDYGHVDYYSADIVLNSGVNPDKALYFNKDDYTQLLLGPKYIPLRREFLKPSRCSKEISPTGNKVLVTMGGSDPHLITLKVVESLIEMDNELQITVVTGPLYSYTELFTTAKNDRRFLMLHDANEIAALMSWADIGISAGGTTLAEMAYMGLPSIIIKTAENQYASKFYDIKFGTSLYLGDAENISNNQVYNSVMSLHNNELKRKKMSENGMRLVDGTGSERIYETLFKLSPSSVSETK